MMRNNRLLIAIIALSLIVTCLVSIRRIGVEGNNRTYDFALDFPKTKDAFSNEKDLEAYIQRMSESGIKYSLIRDERVWDLIQRGEITYSRIRNFSNTDGMDSIEGLQEFINGKVKAGWENKAVLISRDKELINFIYQDIYVGSPELVEEKDFAVIILDNYYFEVELLSVGLVEEDINLLKSYGYQLIPMVSNSAMPNKRDLIELIEHFIIMGSEYIIMDGVEALGYPNNIEEVSRILRDNTITLVIPESFAGSTNLLYRGITKQLDLIDYRSAKAEILDRKSIVNLIPERLAARWFRAVVERNVRILPVPVLSADLNSVDISTQRALESMDRLEAMLDITPYNKGLPSTFTRLESSYMLLFIIYMGIIASGLLLTKLVFDKLKNMYIYIMMFLGALLTLLLSIKLQQSLMITLFAFVSAIVYPSLAIAWGYTKLNSQALLAKEGHQRTKAIIYVFLTMSFVALLGGLKAAALMSTTTYLLKIEIFRGVKIAQFIPMFVLAVIIGKDYIDILGKIDRTNFRASIGKAWKFMYNMMNLKTGIILIIIAAGLYIYIGRIGHQSGVPVLDVEANFREMLERILVARPRNKEFLIGHPVMLATLYFISSKNSHYLKLLLFAGLIGQTSIVNTLVHMRTPLLISMLRIGYGLVFGIVIGLGLIMAVRLWIKHTAKYRRMIDNE